MPKKRKFFRLDPDSSKNPPGLIFENEEKLRLPGILIFGMPDVRQRGFPPLSEPPRFRYRRSEGRKPLDLEIMGRYWIITTRTKEVFQSVDPAAFVFVACHTIIDGVDVIGDFWLCDVVRILDAPDEERTKPIIYENGRRHYRFIGFEDLHFREDFVGNNHVFRIDYSWSDVICDNVLRQACKEAKLKSLMFDPAIQRVFKMHTSQERRYAERKKTASCYYKNLRK